MPSCVKPSVLSSNSNFSAVSSIGKSKLKKNSRWSKFFDHGGGKVTPVVGGADEHTVDLSQLYIGDKLGHGANSLVYRGVYKDAAVAVKVIPVPDKDDETGGLAARLERQFNQEVTSLSRLHHHHHPDVIKFVGAGKRPHGFLIVTEYLSEGSLRAYLHKLEDAHTTMSLKKVIPLALEIARGMEYIHSQGIIHRDLKPENVLIDQDFHMKIADFGSACEEAHYDPVADNPGTYRWMAPEMIKRKNYGRKVDVYSFGLMLWEMISGCVPFEKMNPIQAAYGVLNKNLRPAFPQDCPSAMRALIEQCWSSQPEKRPEFWQVVKVLEEFESSLAHDGTLKMVHNSIYQEDHNNGFLHWIHKLRSRDVNGWNKGFLHSHSKFCSKAIPL